MLARGISVMPADSRRQRVDDWIGDKVLEMMSAHFFKEGLQGKGQGLYDCKTGFKR